MNARRLSETGQRIMVGLVGPLERLPCRAEHEDRRDPQQGRHARG